MSRLLDISHKFSLKDVSEGWDDCYLLYRPVTMGDLIKIQAANIHTSTNDKAMDFMQTFVKEHVAGGKVLSGGQLVELEPDDIDMFGHEIITSLFKSFTEVSIDPKDTPKEALPLSASSNSMDTTTKE